MARLHRRFLLPLVIAAAGALPAPPMASAAPVDPSTIHVIDGDTIATPRQKVRLVGFDTPETYEPRCDYELALGNAATQRLRDLLGSGRPVELVMLPGRDRYGRGLGRLYIAQVDVADILMNEGLARRYDGGRRSGWCS